MRFDGSSRNWRVRATQNGMWRDDRICILLIEFFTQFVFQSDPGIRKDFWCFAERYCVPNAEQSSLFEAIYGFLFFEFMTGAHCVGFPTSRRPHLEEDRHTERASKCIYWLQYGSHSDAVTQLSHSAWKKWKLP